MNRNGRQTKRQRIMRNFAYMVYLDGSDETSLRSIAQKVWAIYPKAYNDFQSFYRSLSCLAKKYVKNSSRSSKNILRKAR